MASALLVPEGGEAAFEPGDCADIAATCLPGVGELVPDDDEFVGDVDVGERWQIETVKAQVLALGTHFVRDVVLLEASIVTGREPGKAIPGRGAPIGRAHAVPALRREALPRGGAFVGGS